MLTNFITKTFYYMYISFPCRLMINRHMHCADLGLVGTVFNQSESSKLKKMILTEKKSNYFQNDKKKIENA